MAYKFITRVATGKTPEEAAKELHGVPWNRDTGEVFMDSHVVRNGDEVSIIVISYTSDKD